MPTAQSRAIKKFSSGEEIVGSFTFSPDAAHTEIMQDVGLDFVLIDTEHAPLEAINVQDHVRATRPEGITPFARVRHNSGADVGRLLDVGVEGIVFPHLGLHPEETQEALRALRYAPEGNRPTCSGVRAIDYGLRTLSDYAPQSNAQVVSIGLIEDAEVVDDIDRVLSEYDVDVVIPGSGDLATSLGVPGEHTHPRVLEALDRVVTATKALGRSRVGMYLADPAQAGRWRAAGVDFFIVSIDYRILANAYRSALSEFDRS